MAQTYDDGYGHKVVAKEDLQISRSTSAKTGGKIRCKCPECSTHEGNKPNSDCVSIDLDTGWGHCFRCGTVFLLESHYKTWKEGQEKRYAKKKYNLPTADYFMPNFGTKTMEYLKFRCISTETAHKLGIRTRVIEHGAEKEEYLGFPFIDGSNTIDVQFKLASKTEKKFFFEQGCEKIPYNVNSAIGASQILITEGMMDAAACVECGYDAVVSLPNGAQSDLRCFDKYKDYFAHATIIYAGDTDNPGIEARNKVAAYFGEARMKFVDWTYRWKDDEGEDNMHCAKDANQLLMEKGRDAVVWCIEHAKKMNVAGLVELDSVESQLDDLYENGLPKAKDLHVAKLNNVFRIEDGLIYLGFAAPGSGKSTMMNFIMMSMVHLYDTHILVYSPEKYPTARHYSEMINVMTGKTFNKGKLIEPAYKRGKDICREYIREIDANVTNDIDGILHIAQQEYYQGLCDMLVIDPFNWIQLPEQTGITDTMKYTMLLMKIVQFAHQYKVPVFMMHHPRKFDDKTKLTINDIFGSSDFGNKSDYVFWLDRKKDEDPMKEVTYWNCIKCRWNEIGKTGTVALKYSTDTMRYAGCNQNFDKTYSPISEDTADWTKHEATSLEIDFNPVTLPECPF